MAPSWYDRNMEGVTKEYVVKEVLLGTTIGFAQVPESVAFAFLANVSPPIALHAAWMLGLVCSIFGGRPGMVNGATGAFAAIIGTFLPEPEINGGNGAGIEKLFPSVMFAGLLMLFVSATKLSRFIILLPSPVMIGFCNGLAIVIGLAQLHPFQDPDTHEFKKDLELLWMLVEMMAAMLIMEFFPKIPTKLTDIIPSSLVGIIAAIVIEFAIVRPTGSRTDTIGDINEFSAKTAIPSPFFIKWGFQDYNVSDIGLSDMGDIFRQGLLLCIVGSIESLMTSEVVESFTKTPGDGDRTVLAMGFGNILSGFFGGMGGNAMIGLSTINVLNGGRGRLAPTCTALLVMVAVIGAYPALNIVPTAALAGIMLVVVMHTFKWFSLKMVFATFVQTLPRAMTAPWAEKLPVTDARPSEVAVILVVSIMAILSNIAYAVGAGVAACCMIYAWNSVSDFKVTVTFDGAAKCYDVVGPVYFATANRLIKLLDPTNDPDTVYVRYTGSAINDYSVVDTFNRITSSYKAQDKTISFIASALSSVSSDEEAPKGVKNTAWATTSETSAEIEPWSPADTDTVPSIADKQAFEIPLAPSNPSMETTDRPTGAPALSISPATAATTAASPAFADDIPGRVASVESC